MHLLNYIMMEVMVSYTIEHINIILVIYTYLTVIWVDLLVERFLLLIKILLDQLVWNQLQDLWQ